MKQVNTGCNQIMDTLNNMMCNITSPNKPKLRIAIEGNIGSGKSTFLQNMPDYVTKVQEPVSEWLELKDEFEKPLFEHFYEKPSKYSFLLQMNILASRYKTMNDIMNTNSDICMFERSIMTTKHIFVNSLYEMNEMTKMEHDVFNNMYDSINPDMFVDGIIYLRCAPHISYSRIMRRNRKCESTITLEYLKTLHNKHEEWLCNTNDSKIPIYIIDATREGCNYDISMLESFLRSVQK